MFLYWPWRKFSLFCNIIFIFQVINSEWVFHFHEMIFRMVVCRFFVMQISISWWASRLCWWSGLTIMRTIFKCSQQMMPDKLTLSYFSTEGFGFFTYSHLVFTSIRLCVICITQREWFPIIHFPFLSLPSVD